jgi:hypothetical protein
MRFVHPFIRSYLLPSITAISSSVSPLRQFIHQFVNLLIRRLDLTLVQRAVMFRRGGMQALVQFQHLLDERHHAVVTGYVGRIAPACRDML